MKTFIQRKLAVILLPVLLALSLGLSGCSAAEGIKPVTISVSKAEDILQKIPAYEDTAYVTVNDNVPFFEESELTTEAFESYSALDSLGRCGVALLSFFFCVFPGLDTFHGFSTPLLIKISLTQIRDGCL